MKRINKWQIRIFLLCWVAYASIYFGRVNLSVALPAIQDAFGWTKGQIGLIGSLFFWVYGFGQLINGQIGDRVSTRKIIFFGLIITAIVNICFGFCNTFFIMIVLWIFNAYAQSTLWGPMVKSLANWFDYEKRSKIAIGISTSMVGGYLLAWGLSGAIIARSKWNFAFWIPGVCILIYSIVWLLFFRNHPKEVDLKLPNTILKEYNMKNKSEYTLLQVIVESKLWFVVIACFVQGIIKDGIALWAPSLFMETQNLDIKQTTQFIIFIPIMNFFGMMLAGYLNKKLNNQEKLTTVILFAIGMGMILGFVKFGPISTVVALVFLGLSSAMMFGANTLLLGVIPMNFAKYNKASTIAGFLDFCSYVAAGFAAFITGSIVDRVGWGGVMIFWIVCSMVGILALLFSWNYDKIAKRKQEESEQLLDYQIIKEELY
jgi:OPA family glycerol-3-phosphate transporter-like MFS transporter